MNSGFGDWLIARRKAVGLETQQELAGALEIAGVAVSRAAISKWERGLCRPSLHHREYLFRVLAVWGEDQRRQLNMAIDGYVDFPAVAA